MSYKINFKSLSMNSVFKKFLVLFSLGFLFQINISKASHATGAEFSYIYAGPNTYDIVYRFYRDCHGISPGTVIEVQVTNDCGYPPQTFIMTQFGAETDVVTTCQSAITECHGGTYFGLQEWVYMGTVTFPGPCVWQLAKGISARNASISTIVGNGSDSLYVYCTINNNSGINNTSPFFYNEPIITYNVNQRLSIDNSAFDDDEDSLTFELIKPRTGPSVNDTVTFLAGYSYSQPFISGLPVTINSVTGLIEGFPLQSDVTLYAVLVSEFRNGVMIGQIERDINLKIENSINTLPDISGINGTGNFEVDVFADQNNCFQIFSSDVNSTSATIANVYDNISGMSIINTGWYRDTLNICWNPYVSDTIGNPYCFTVTVYDDNCPVQGYQSRDFCFNVQMPVSIDEINSSFINIYPNPFNSLMNVKLGFKGKSELALFDMQGRKIISKTLDLSESVHDFSDLENGMYVVTVSTLETNRVFYQRLLKGN